MKGPFRKVVYRHSPAVSHGWHIGLKYAKRERRRCFFQTPVGGFIALLLYRKTPGGKSQSRLAWLTFPGLAEQTQNPMSLVLVQKGEMPIKFSPVLTLL